MGFIALTTRYGHPVLVDLVRWPNLDSMSCRARVLSSSWRQARKTVICCVLWNRSKPCAPTCGVRSDWRGIEPSTQGRRGGMGHQPAISMTAALLGLAFAVVLAACGVLLATGLVPVIDTRLELLEEQ